MASRSVFLLCLLLLVACSPETDRERYRIGEPGVVTFLNSTRVPVYLAGCSHFDYQKQIGAEWIAQGPAAVCVWEGFAQPVAPGAAIREPIETREPGRWRLHYRVGIGCSESAPLAPAHCRWVGDLTSNEFEVVASGCVVSGCSGQVCDDRPWATTCEWRPEYACFRAARCGRFGADGACGWEQTPELLTCLADPPQPGW
jgi:hypothetical protein